MALVAMTLTASAQVELATYDGKYLTIRMTAGDVGNRRQKKTAGSERDSLIFFSVVTRPCNW